jgi:hypothetical protein
VYPIRLRVLNNTLGESLLFLLSTGGGPRNITQRYSSWVLLVNVHFSLFPISHNHSLQADNPHLNVSTLKDQLFYAISKNSSIEEIMLGCFQKNKYSPQTERSFEGLLFSFEEHPVSMGNYRLKVVLSRHMVDFPHTLGTRGSLYSWSRFYWLTSTYITSQTGLCKPIEIIVIWDSKWTNQKWGSNSEPTFAWKWNSQRIWPEVLPFSFSLLSEKRFRAYFKTTSGLQGILTKEREDDILLLNLTPAHPSCTKS